PPGAERGRAPRGRRLDAGGTGAGRDRAAARGGVITRDTQAFLALARGMAPDFGPATARAAFLVTPEGFARAEQSALDNRYMAAAGGYHCEAALAEHRALQ